MFTLAIALGCFVLVYIGFLVLTATLSNQCFVKEKINTIQISDKFRGIRISTVVLSNEAGITEAGLFVFGYDRMRSYPIEHSQTFPLTLSDVNAAISVLKKGTPFILNMGDKNQFRLNIKSSSESALVTIRTNSILQYSFRVVLSDSTLDELLTAFENLLKTDKVKLKLSSVL